MLGEIDYWDDMRDSPSLMEQVFAIFANVLAWDDQGVPHQRSRRRAPAEWIRQYMTGQQPERDWEDWEVALY